MLNRNWYTYVYDFTSSFHYNIISSKLWLTALYALQYNEFDKPTVPFNEHNYKYLVPSNFNQYKKRFIS